MYLGIGRMSAPIDKHDLNVEPLFDESIVVVTSAHSEWANRAEIDVEDLSNASWILAPPPNMARELVERTFRAKGLVPPRPKVTTYSMQLRLQILTSGRYITVFTDSNVSYSDARLFFKILQDEL